MYVHQTSYWPPTGRYDIQFSSLTFCYLCWDIVLGGQRLHIPSALQGLLSDRNEKQLSDEHISRLFVFALMWSTGALLEPDDRLKMELFLRKHSAVKELPAVNEEETMFEFGINACGQWEHWSKKVRTLWYAKAFLLSIQERCVW